MGKKLVQEEPFQKGWLKIFGEELARAIKKLKKGAFFSKAEKIEKFFQNNVPGQIL